MLPSCVSDDKLSSYLDLSAVCIHLYLIMTDLSPICSELLELMIYRKANGVNSFGKKTVVLLTMHNEAIGEPDPV